MQRLFLSVGLLILSGIALAQTNTTAGTAADFVWGNKVTSSLGNGTQFWFTGAVVAGRSYCVETGQNELIFGDKYVDSVLTVYRLDQATVIASNDELAQEPLGGSFSRACFRAATSEVMFVKLTNFATNATQLSLRFTETTLFCPWFFIAGDYNAFSLLRNTTDQNLANVVITWRGLDGTVAGTTTVSIPGNGGVIVNAASFVNPALFSNGTVEVAHPGAPDQVVGSTTTLSGTTGLGFDAPFSQRRPW